LLREPSSIGEALHAHRVSLPVFCWDKQGGGGLKVGGLVCGGGKVMQLAVV